MLNYSFPESEILKEFNLNPNLVYLNSGTHSICPRSVMKLLQQEREDFEKNPTAGLVGAWTKLWGVQKRVAQFFNAPAAEIFLRPSVTAVLNQGILGVTLPENQPDIATTQIEYGAIINICRYRAEQEGRRLFPIVLPVDPKEFQNYSAQDWVDTVISKLEKSVGMLVLSEVMTGNGLILPIAEIARETRKRGIFLVVDGAHSPGSIEVEFSKLEDVDFYGGNLHKWMMGPKGTAFGWMPKRVRERIRFLNAGWTTFESVGPYAGFSPEDLFGAQMAPSACQDFSPYFGLHATLDFWKKWGTEAIRKRIYDLQKMLETEVEKNLGWECVSPEFGNQRGPLLSYALPQSVLNRHGSNPWDWMAELLNQYGLQVSTPVYDGHRKHCIRLSPHIYNSNEDIEKVIDILKRAS